MKEDLIGVGMWHENNILKQEWYSNDYYWSSLQWIQGKIPVSLGQVQEKITSMTKVITGKKSQCG